MDLRITLVLLAGLLILVSLLQPIATRLRLPASVLLALVGITLGVVSTLVARAAPDSALATVARLFVNLPVDSNTFLYVILIISLVNARWVSPESSPPSLRAWC